MKGAVRQALLWGPLALSAKNWVADVSTIEGLRLRRHDPLSHGDWVLVHKYSVRVLGRFRRGDVVYVRSPERADRHWVRRLIGIEGDWVSEQGELRKVPQGHCWLEGSGQTAGTEPSGDCSVPLALLEGRVSHVIWPPSHIGAVESFIPPGKLLGRGDSVPVVES